MRKCPHAKYDMYRYFECFTRDYHHKNLKMNFLKFLSATSAAASLIKGPGDCYWTSAGSGYNIECLPEFYIKGGCESGSRDDCKFDGILGGEAFGIRCCPVDRTLALGERNNCEWNYGTRQGSNFQYKPKITLLHEFGYPVDQ